MKKKKEFLTSNVCFKVTASQKAEYEKIAKSKGLSTGEWVRISLNESFQIPEDAPKKLIKTKKIREITKSELKKAISNYHINEYNEKFFSVKRFVISAIIFLVLLIIGLGVFL